MESTGGRKLSREVLHERHHLTVRQYKRGRSKRVISRDLGVSYPTVCTTIWHYEREGKRRLRLSAGQTLGTRVALRTKAKLKHATEAHMINLETQPERVRALFGNPHVKYAA